MRIVLSIFLFIDFLFAQTSAKTMLYVHKIDCNQVEQTENTSVIISELLQQELMRVGVYKVSEEIALNELFNEASLSDAGVIEKNNQNFAVQSENTKESHITGKCIVQAKKTILTLWLDQQKSFSQILTEDELEVQIQKIAFLISGKKLREFNSYRYKKDSKVNYLGAFLGANYASVSAHGIGSEDEFSEEAIGGVQLRFVSWNQKFDFEVSGTIPNHYGNLGATGTWWMGPFVGWSYGWNLKSVTISEGDQQKYSFTGSEMLTGISLRFAQKWKGSVLAGYQNGTLVYSGEYNQRPVVIRSKENKWITPTVNLKLDMRVNENFWISGFYNVTQFKSEEYALYTNEYRYYSNYFNYRWEELMLGLSLGWLFAGI